MKNDTHFRADERRAKFRQDLISEQKTSESSHAHLLRKTLTLGWHHRAAEGHDAKKQPAHLKLERPASGNDPRYRPKRHHPHQRVRNGQVMTGAAAPSAATPFSFDSATVAQERRRESRRLNGKASDPITEDDQDILEVWFAGKP